MNLFEQLFPKTAALKQRADLASAKADAAKCASIEAAARLKQTLEDMLDEGLRLKVAKVENNNVPRSKQ